MWATVKCPLLGPPKILADNSYGARSCRPAFAERRAAYATSAPESGRAVIHHFPHSTRPLRSRRICWDVFRILQGNSLHQIGQLILRGVRVAASTSRCSMIVSLRSPSRSRARWTNQGSTTVHAVARYASRRLAMPSNRIAGSTLPAATGCMTIRRTPSPFIGSRRVRASVIAASAWRAAALSPSRPRLAICNRNASAADTVRSTPSSRTVTAWERTASCGSELRFPRGRPFGLPLCPLP